ncbi:hypothetical protein DFW101_2994 [Solidesulfovibrio carbinoliphilus subsp. oakridgensis]|uniref:Uncharacterized protein n=1 Tax=Solidesulfovibrio carbinoliphilus subsp. oakridgensis TaxID=694327 RepID=G7Q5J3_9BACT|nr:hypothetical protein [Solidesulfovibrio carbinoliphilus]EHJ48994.1 hypothetical protein DFW101_2994 [Solidesulfovibrio carbinoliphilus subsp. oakridgensis]
MDASSLGSLAAAMDKQTIGAEVVSKTLDAMNGFSATSSTPTDKQTFGAAVVGKTLEYMNSGGTGSHAASDMSQTYNFSKDVLGAYTSGVGSLADYSA